MNVSADVILPCYRAHETVFRAAESVIAAARHWPGGNVRLIVAVDDEQDYGYLGEQLAGTLQTVTVTTGGVGRGPAAARNAALRVATADYIGTIDADDLWEESRLARLIPIAAAHGAVVDNTRLRSADGTDVRTAAPPGDGHRPLDLSLLLSARLPFHPIFRRDLAPEGGWPDLPFAEDLVFNTMLRDRAPGMRFSASPGYQYVQRPGSLAYGADTLARAEAAYAEIERHLDRSGGWFRDAEIARALRAQIEIDRESNADYARRRRPGESLTAFMSRTRGAGQDL